MLEHGPGTLENGGGRGEGKAVVTDKGLSGRTEVQFDAVGRTCEHPHNSVSLPT